MYLLNLVSFHYLDILSWLIKFDKTANVFAICNISATPRLTSWVKPMNQDRIKIVNKTILVSTLGSIKKFSLHTLS